MREPLLTNRLLLRDITQADANLLFDLDSDSEVMRYIGPCPAPDLASYRDRISSVYVPWQAHPWHGIRMVLDRANGEFLGWVFIRPAIASKSAREIGWTRPDEVEVGYRYHRSAWGRGIATEAATLLVQIASRTQRRRPSSRVLWPATRDRSAYWRSSAWYASAK